MPSSARLVPPHHVAVLWHCPLTQLLGVMQEMYDKQSQQERGYGSDADSGGVVGFGKPRAAKSIMTDEQVLPSAPMFDTVSLPCMLVSLSDAALISELVNTS